MQATMLSARIVVAASSGHLRNFTFSATTEPLCKK